MASLSSTVITLSNFKFNNNNFHTWQQQAEMLLMKKGLWGSVIGSISCPRLQEKLPEWFIQHQKATRVIGSTLDKTFAHHIDTHMTAKEAWEHLESLFGAKLVNLKFM